jgi:hypothetical protein
MTSHRAGYTGDPSVRTDPTGDTVTPFDRLLPPVIADGGTCVMSDGHAEAGVATGVREATV